MKEKKDFDVSFNTTLSDGKGGGGINVVSKKKLSQTPENYAKLREKFQRIEESRLAKEAADQGAEGKAEGEKEEMLSRKPADSASEGRNKRIVLITHFNVFLYAACYWIQSGTLPYLTKSLGADPVIFGRLKTVFSLCQLVGGPIYGRLGDLMGERTALITAFFSKHSHIHPDRTSHLSTSSLSFESAFSISSRDARLPNGCHCSLGFK